MVYGHFFQWKHNDYEVYEIATSAFCAIRSVYVVPVFYCTNDSGFTKEKKWKLRSCVVSDINHEAFSLNLLWYAKFRLGRPRLKMKYVSLKCKTISYTIKQAKYLSPKYDWPHYKTPPLLHTIAFDTKKGSLFSATHSSERHCSVISPDKKLCCFYGTSTSKSVKSNEKHRALDWHSWKLTQKPQIPSITR